MTECSRSSLNIQDRLSQGKRLHPLHRNLPWQSSRDSSTSTKPLMKNTLILIAVIAAVALLIIIPRSGAQAGAAPRWEYAMAKWDGPDKMQYITPGKFEHVRMLEQGVSRPKDAQEEEFFLMIAANKMAQEGWEPINLDSRRILFRRAAR